MVLHSLTFGKLPKCMLRFFYKTFFVCHAGDKAHFPSVTRVNYTGLVHLESKPLSKTCSIKNARLEYSRNLAQIEKWYQPLLYV